MILLWWIVVGAIAGWLSGQVIKDRSFSQLDDKVYIPVNELMDR